MLVRLWEGFGQKYRMFRAPAFCVAGDEGSFSQSSCHAKYLHPGKYLLSVNSVQCCRIRLKAEPVQPVVCRGLGTSSRIWGLTEDKGGFFSCLFSPGCACSSSQSWWQWSLVRSIFLHAFPWSPWIFKICLPRLPIGLLLLFFFFLFSALRTELLLEPLVWVTAAFLFQDHLVALKRATQHRCYLALDGKTPSFASEPQGHYQH